MSQDPCFLYISGDAVGSLLSQVKWIDAHHEWCHKVLLEEFDKREEEVDDEVRRVGWERLKTSRKEWLEEAVQRLNVQ